MPHFEPIIGIHDYKIISAQKSGCIEFFVEYVGILQCPFCSGQRLRKKDSFLRRIKHFSIGTARSVLLIRSHKFKCRSCSRYFNQRLPGIRPRFQSSQPFREEVALKHHWGMSRKKSAETSGISWGSVERCYKSYLENKNSHRKNASCPRVLGIDEKHFTRKIGFMTTLADLKRHKVYDLVLGRSEKSLEGYLNKMPDKKNCKVVVMDLSETYRSIAKKHLPQAMIVADRFHVVKLINHHFLKTWQDLDEVGRKNRGLLSLMRRHEHNLRPEQKTNLRDYLKKNPAIETIYDFKQCFTQLILARVSSKDQAKKIIPEFINGIEKLKTCGLKHLETLAPLG